MPVGEGSKSREGGHGCRGGAGHSELPGGSRVRGDPGQILISYEA